MACKLFGTDGVRGVANVYPITVDFALSLSKAAAKLVCNDKMRVAIAKDTRISGDMIESALVAGFTSQGIDVVCLGVLPTPALTILTPQLDVDMSVMITASHNPYQDNGIKLVTASGDKFGDDVTEQIESLILENKFSYDMNDIGVVINDYSAIEKYKDIVLSIPAEQNALSGLKVVIDGANGVFSTIMPEIFEELGAEVISIGCSPDGYNINKSCGSQHIEKMSETIIKCEANLGIAVDGDGDRIIVCDENGNKINSEQLIAFLAKYYNDLGTLNSRPVVSTILSNTGLETYVKSLGVDYYSTNVGERYVIEKMQEVKGLIGGEESGHVVISDYSKSGDALVVALVLSLGLLKSKQKMSEVFPIFDFEPFVFVSPRFDCQSKIKEIMTDATVLSVIDKARDDIRNIGRVVVRASGTEPLIRIWVGGIDKAIVEQVAENLIEVIEAKR